MSRMNWSGYDFDDLIDAVRAGVPNAAAAAKRRIAEVRSKESAAKMRAALERAQQDHRVSLAASNVKGGE